MSYRLPKASYSSSKTPRLSKKFTQVKTVWLEVGQLACVEQESLRFFFAVVTEDSIARQAKLEIIEIAGQAICDQCHQVMMIAAYHQACPQCGSYALHVTHQHGRSLGLRQQIGRAHV